MKFTFSFIETRLSRILFIVVAILIVGTTLIKWSKLPPQIPLFYSRTEGEEQIVDLIYLLILPFLAVTLVIINTVVCKKFFAGNEFVTKIMNFVNTSTIILFTLIYLRIIFLVT